jgi:hypothetical protein
MKTIKTACVLIKLILIKLILLIPKTIVIVIRIAESTLTHLLKEIEDAVINTGEYYAKEKMEKRT